MAVSYGTTASSSSGTSQLRVCCNYTESTAATGVKTVTYYYYLEVTKGDFSGTAGYVSWNPNASFTLNGVGIYQKSTTYTLTIPAGGAAKSIESASGGYLNTSSRRSTLNAISIASAPVPSFTNTISHWAGGFKNSEGNNGSKNLFFLANTTFTKSYGASMTLTANDATTIPNGFYLNNVFGTSSVTGSWQSYALGTSLAQQAKAMAFEYDYYPYTYSITYDLDGGTNNSSNPATYNVLYGVSLKEPTKPYYIFNGWGIQTEAKNVTIAAVNGNYNYVRILNNIQPGVTYGIGIDSAVLNSGTATQFTIKIYDFTSPSVLTTSRYNNLGGSVNLTLTCPSTADASHDIAIIMYAGVVGATANNSITCTGLSISYYATGINEGDNATFSSSSDLYTKLNGRMTGDVTVKAVWEPYKYTITFDGNGGTTTVDSLEVAYETTQNNDVSQYIPQRQAYEFLGWYTSPTDGVQVYDANGLCTNDGTYWLNNVCIYTGDYTLYAHWKPLNIGYGRQNGEWKLYHVYKKVNDIWYPCIMQRRLNGDYDLEIAILMDEEGNYFTDEDGNILVIIE